MAGQGIQFLPLSRIPAKWDPTWFALFCREVLALADTRNATEGSGITITGQPGEVATISASDDLQNLLLQSFVVAQPSGFLQFERTLAGEDGVIQILDGGPNSNITAALVDYGITLGKLRKLSGLAILGNPVDGIGEIQAIQPEADKSVLHLNGTAIEFDLIDSSYVSDFAEAAQDAVGSIVNDTPSIDLTYDDGLGVISAALVDEYAQDLVGAMLVDSSSVDFTYDDTLGQFTAQVLESWAPLWTANHRWTDTDEVQLGTGGDLRLFHDGTDCFVRFDTGVLNISRGAQVIGRFDASATADDTQFMLWDVTAGALVRVSRDAVDTAGTGFRALRIPN